MRVRIYQNAMVSGTLHVTANSFANCNTKNTYLQLIAGKHRPIKTPSDPHAHMHRLDLTNLY